MPDICNPSELHLLNNSFVPSSNPPFPTAVAVPSRPKVLSPVETGQSPSNQIHPSSKKQVSNPGFPVFFFVNTGVCPSYDALAFRPATGGTRSKSGRGRRRRRRRGPQGQVESKKDGRTQRQARYSKIQFDSTSLQCFRAFVSHFISLFVNISLSFSDDIGLEISFRSMVCDNSQTIRIEVADDTDKPAVGCSMNKKEDDYFCTR